MPRNEATASYQKPLDSGRLNAAKDEFIQNLAAQAKPKQELFVQKADQTLAEQKKDGNRYDFYAEDPKLRVFGRAQAENQRKGANLLLADAAPEYFKYLKEEKASQALANGNYKPSKEVKDIDKRIAEFKQDYEVQHASLKAERDEAAKLAGRGANEEEFNRNTRKFERANDDLKAHENELSNLESAKKRQIENEVWLDTKLTGADVHMAAKVNVLIQQGILERDKAINKDIAQNIDNLINQAPALKNLQEQGKLTPQSLASDVQGALAIADQVDLSQSTAQTTESPSSQKLDQDVATKVTVADKLAAEKIAAKGESPEVDSKAIAKSNKESIKDKLKSYLDDKRQSAEQPELNASRGFKVGG